MKKSKYLLLKRNFDALNYEIASNERRYCNTRAETSEYHPSHKWVIEGENFSMTKKTKKEAQEMINNLDLNNL